MKRNKTGPFGYLSLLLTKWGVVWCWNITAGFLHYDDAQSHKFNLNRCGCHSTHGNT